MKKCFIEAPFVEQMPELPRGCEVTSLSLLLQHAGVNVDKLQLAKEIEKVPFLQDGIYGHLNDGFVGDMYSFDTDGLGVYHRPIEKLAENYLPNQVVNLTGCQFDTILESIRDGFPVWVITNDTFALLKDHHFKTWKTRLGNLPITYRMHSVLVVGYDEEFIYIHDPLYHQPSRPISRNDFEEAWIQMGRQAITYKG